MAKKLPPYTTYLIIAAATAFFFTLMGTVSGVYRVSVGLTPLQLVLVGTVLELSVFLFEVPTGIVADLYSRRLSIIIGYAIWGLGFILEGSTPLVGTILLAQAIWGLGYTFTSGAQDAWLADELGEERLTQTYLRASQLSQVASLVAIGLSVFIATFARGLPLVFGGVGLVGLALFLWLFMPENSFTPVERTERETWRQMIVTFREGVSIIRGRQVLLIIFAIEIFIGLHSEGIDRLWEAHLLRNFTLPQLGEGWDIVYWFGIIEITIMIGSLLVTELVRRRLDAENEERSLRFLVVFNGLIIAGVLTFALTSSVTVAIAAFMALSIFRGTIFPLKSAWVNKKVGSRVRATVLSMLGQTNAISQVISGPLMGAIATLVGLRAAFVSVAALLLPTLPLYWRASRSRKE